MNEDHGGSDMAVTIPITLVQTHHHLTVFTIHFTAIPRKAPVIHREYVRTAKWLEHVVCILVE